MVYPLSAGLLISMAQRENHGFGALPPTFITNGYGRVTGIATDGDESQLDVQQIKLIDQALSRYLAHCMGEPIPPQQLEEISGRGFYAPQSEGYYLLQATTVAGNHAIHAVAQGKAILLLAGLTEGQLE